MSEFLSMLGVIGLGVLILVVLPGFILWSQIRMKQAVTVAARTLGLAEGGEPPADEEWNVSTLWSGRIGGCTAILAKGTKLVATPGGVASHVPITSVLIDVRYPKPLSFRIEMRRKGGIYTDSDVRTGDAAFDGACVVSTGDASAARALLASAQVRQRAAAFLKEGKGSATVDERGVFTPMFDAHFRGPDGVVRRVKEAAELARALGAVKRG